MIRWCSYCQAFLGEVAPFDDMRFSHGICPSCLVRVDSGEPVIQETESVRVLVRRLTAGARERNGPACDAILAEARALGLGDDSLVIGLLQPALYQAGNDWQAGGMTVTEEHFLTDWADRVFSTLPVVPPTSPIDLLIFQASGNTHVLGARFAARILAGQGISVHAAVSTVPLEEMIILAKSLVPRAIGVSCALPAHIPMANALVARLRERLAPDLRCRYLMSGAAIRSGAQDAVASGIEVVIDLVSFAESFRTSERPAHRHRQSG